jgi:hypothetical protein
VIHLSNTIDLREQSRQKVLQPGEHHVKLRRFQKPRSFGDPPEYLA